VFLALLQTSPAGPGGNPIVGFLPILLIFAVFYFLMFLPMQRQRKKQQQMLASLEAGQDVVTSGGIVGQIVAINKENDSLILRVKPDGVKLQIARSAVSALIPQAAEKK
jgi:preprotein translocase subunit YajC